MRSQKPEAITYRKQYMKTYMEKYRKEHSEKYRKLAKDWYSKNSERVLRQKKEWREKAIVALGGICVCCGENDALFLTIDHVNNDGAEHRRLVNRGYYRHIALGQLDYEMQILCSNCNSAKQWYGECPHKYRNIEEFSLAVLEYF